MNRIKSHEILASDHFLLAGLDEVSKCRKRLGSVPDHAFDIMSYDHRTDLSNIKSNGYTKRTGFMIVSASKIH